MKFVHYAALSCALGFAAGASWEDDSVEGVSSAQTILTSAQARDLPYYHYIGYGRAADIQTDIGSYTNSFGSTCTVQLDVVYLTRDHDAIARETCRPATPGEDCRTSNCLPLTQQDSHHCVATSNVDGHGYNNNKQVLARRLTETIGFPALPANLRIAQIFKAHGTMSYEWFLKTTITQTEGTAGSCAVDLTASKIEPYNPDQYFCAGRNDDTHPASGQAGVDYKNIRPDNAHLYPFVNATYPDIGYFSDTADLPFSPTSQHYAEDLAVVGPPAGGADESFFFNLGASPQIDYSCLNVYLTSLGKPKEGCASIRIGVGENAGTPTNWGFNLLDVEDCGVLPYPESVCCGNDKAGCGSETRENCFWNAQMKQCYARGNVLDLKPNPSGDNELASRDNLMHSFISNNVNGPKSSWVATEAQIARKLDGLNRRRWFFELTVAEKSTDITTQCEWQASVSFVSHTTGGICEPTTRLRCDRQAEQCFGNDWPFTAWPRYWRSIDSEFTVRNTDSSKYKTCNCLKQKEVCLRQGGCYATNRYANVLDNCLEEKCGNWCNPAGTAQYSVAALLVAAVALLL